MVRGGLWSGLVVGVCLCVGSLCVRGSESSLAVSVLSPDAQAKLVGQLCDIDCQTIPSGCSTRPACSTHSQCEPYFWASLCTDTTQNETCSLLTTFGLACVVDPPHTCWPYVVADGTCNLLLGLCSVEGNQGNCGATVATQCHY